MEGPGYYEFCAKNMRAKFFFGTGGERTCVCVCSTHIEPRGGKTKVKARVHAFGWEIEKRASQNCFSGEQKEKQTVYVLSPFHFAFSFLCSSSSQSPPTTTVQC